MANVIACTEKHCSLEVIKSDSKVIFSLVYGISLNPWDAWYDICQVKYFPEKKFRNTNLFIVEFYFDRVLKTFHFFKILLRFGNGWKIDFPKTVKIIFLCQLFAVLIILCFASKSLFRIVRSFASWWVRIGIQGNNQIKFWDTCNLQFDSSYRQTFIFRWKLVIYIQI